MKYVERVIQRGETVQYLSTIHWIVYLPTFLFLIVGAIGVTLMAKSGADPLALSLTLPLVLTGAACIAGLLYSCLVQALDNRTRRDRSADHIQTRLHP